jgi:hypothetical protein
MLCRQGGTVKARVTLTGRSLSLTGRAVLGEGTCDHEMAPLAVIAGQRATSKDAA